MTDKVSLNERKVLVDNLVILDGFTRAGKFFLGNCLAAIEGVENAQYYGMFEHFPYLLRHNLITKETAKEIIKCQIDNLSYDRMAGRNINFRYDDNSSIFKWLHLKEYLGRCLGGDGDLIVEKIKNEGRYFPFIVHEVWPNIEIYFEMYPKLKVIFVERSPVDLAYQWFIHGWGRRYGTDYKDFSMPIKGPTGPVPWFAASWADEYESSSEADRVIKSLYHVSKMGEETLSKLSEENKNKIHFSTYEGLTYDTEKEIKKIAEFLGKNTLAKELAIISAKEKIPRKSTKVMRVEKLAVLKEGATPEAFARLKEMEEGYRKKWLIEGGETNALL